MMVLSMDEIYAHSSDMLAQMAGKAGGPGFRTFVCLDAIIILCGGVMTAIVGVSGLLTRLAKDKVLPEALATKNSRDAPYCAIITFVLIAISLFLAIFDPKDPNGINKFGGVFAISFLSVLITFAFGAIFLKLYRPKLARLVISTWSQIGLSLSTVLIGFIGKSNLTELFYTTASLRFVVVILLLGNIILTPEVFYLFLAYLSGLVSVASYMFMRVDVLSFMVWMVSCGVFPNKTFHVKDKNI